MSYSKQDVKIAKKIFESSIKEGDIETSRLFSIVDNVKKTNSIKASNILQALLKEVVSFYKKQTLLVESSLPLEQSYLSEIKRIFERKIGRPLTIVFKENKTLIGGIKIKLDDNVWDYSVNQSLEVFKERANG